MPYPTDMIPAPDLSLDRSMHRAVLREGLERVIPDAPGAEVFADELRREILDRTAERLSSGGPRTRHLHPDGRPIFSNRLTFETSPYLLQHAHNPVNWYPWGEEAFATAAVLGRPIFLSIGYSTCHWCHVMEEESFEDLEIAEVLNRDFISIKVDREQRPDVDEVYMAAVQMMTGSGGWPMTVVMTPERKPFFGATYIPPRAGARGSQRGLLELLGSLRHVYGEERGRVVEHAEQFSEEMVKGMLAAKPSGMPGASSIKRVVEVWGRSFDDEEGGVGHAPKFPTPSIYALMLRYHRRSGDERALEMVVKTLDAMAEGGIHDQVGGGFHRYATDRTWLTPHFEKMLYDNAQLAVLYLEANQATGAERFAVTARKTLDYVAKEMVSPLGGFYSATDADSEGEEGLFFVWSLEEIEGLLSEEEAAVVVAHYGVRAGGNFEGNNILSIVESLSEVAEGLSLSLERARGLLDSAHARLYAVRAKRVPPGLDDKIITSWSGLMIQAFARGARVLDEEKYLEVARGAAGFIREHLWRDGRLFRVYGGGQSAQLGFLDDYAFLIGGLLELFLASVEVEWLEWALELQGVQERHFADSLGGYFYSGDEHEALLMRSKPDYDGAEPSGNAVAADNLLIFASLTGDHAYEGRAFGLFSAFGTTLRQRPNAHPRMLSALDRALDLRREIVLVVPEGGQGKSGPNPKEMSGLLRSTFLPSDIYVILGESKSSSLGGIAGPLSGKILGDKLAMAYICESGSCERPVSEAPLLLEKISSLSPYDFSS